MEGMSTTLELAVFVGCCALALLLGWMFDRVHVADEEGR
jgi:hypothetical protein